MMRRTLLALYAYPRTLAAAAHEVKPFVTSSAVLAGSFCKYRLLPTAKSETIIGAGELLAWFTFGGIFQSAIFAFTH